MVTVIPVSRQSDESVGNSYLAGEKACAGNVGFFLNEGRFCFMEKRGKDDAREGQGRANSQQMPQVSKVSLLPRSPFQRVFAPNRDNGHRMSVSFL